MSLRQDSCFIHRIVKIFQAGVSLALHVRLLVANCADERGQTDRQKDIQTDRQTDKHRENRKTLP